MQLSNFPQSIFSGIAHKPIKKLVDWLYKEHCLQALPNLCVILITYHFSLMYGGPTLFSIPPLPATPRYHVDGRFEFNCLIGKCITSLPCIKCDLISRTSNCGKQKTETFPKKGKIFCKKRNIYWVVYPTVRQVFVMDSADIRLHDPMTHWIICRRETFLAPPPKKLSLQSLRLS